MKYAIFSDVHANVTALRKVLEDIRRHDVDKILCLGDVVGYGPEAETAARIVREEVDECIMGNHDAAVAGAISAADFSMTALRGVKRHREECSEETKQWLGELAYFYSEKVKVKSEKVREEFVCAHGDLARPEKFNYIMIPLEAYASYATREEKLMFVGHTHFAAVFVLGTDGEVRSISIEGSEKVKVKSEKVKREESRDEVERVEKKVEQIKLQEGCRYIVNVGSVGYPRHEPWTTYCLYDSEAKTISFYRLAFDFKEYARQLTERGIELPRWLERRISEEGRVKSEEVNGEVRGESGAVSL